MKINIDMNTSMNVLHRIASSHHRNSEITWWAVCLRSRTRSRSPQRISLFRSTQRTEVLTFEAMRPRAWTHFGIYLTALYLVVVFFFILLSSSHFGISYHHTMFHHVARRDMQFFPCCVSLLCFYYVIFHVFIFLVLYLISFFFFVAVVAGCIFHSATTKPHLSCVWMPCSLYSVWWNSFPFHSISQLFNSHIQLWHSHLQLYYEQNVKPNAHECFTAHLINTPNAYKKKQGEKTTILWNLMHFHDHWAYSMHQIHFTFSLFDLSY